jgi:hypothetical protein
VRVPAEEGVERPHLPCIAIRAVNACFITT